MFVIPTLHILLAGLVVWGVYSAASAICKEVASDWRDFQKKREEIS